MSNFVEMVCQFCGEEEFDAPGLKIHILSGNCDAFEAIRVRRVSPFAWEVDGEPATTPNVAPEGRR